MLRWRHEGSEMARFFMYDAFVTYAADDYHDVTESLVRPLRIAGIDVITEHDDFIPGPSKLDIIRECIANCKKIVLVFTPKFVEDDWCREVTIRAMSRSSAVVPVLFEGLSSDVDDSLFKDILDNFRPMIWPRDVLDQNRFIERLTERLRSREDGRTIVNSLL